jgi:hypothetical protein
LHIAAIAIAILLCVAGYVYIMRSLSEQFQVQQEVNLKLPKDQQFEPALWSFQTHRRFRELQQRLLPESPRSKRLRKLQITGFALLASGIAMLVVVLRIWKSL